MREGFRKGGKLSQECAELYSCERHRKQDSQTECLFQLESVRNRGAGWKLFPNLLLYAEYIKTCVLQFRSQMGKASEWIWEVISN